jgi:hypothetical protein
METKEIEKKKRKENKQGCLDLGHFPLPLGPT